MRTPRPGIAVAFALAAACSQRGGNPDQGNDDDDDGGGGDGNITIPSGGNPFVDAVGYINPEYVAEVELSATAHPDKAGTVRKIEAISTAIWLDTISKVSRLPMFLDDALQQQVAKKQAVVPIFVIYDLPDRDCAALASSGELSIASGGVQRYKSDYIDGIAAAFAAHPHQRIVAIIEPDSLGNVATNLGVPRCAGAQAAYREAIAYAINKLSMANTFLYVDAAHAGWLGWTSNTTAIAQIFQEVLTAAGGIDKVRGFITNVANYTVLEATTELFDYQGNPARDELTYAQNLGAALTAVGVSGKGFLIDTSRNGRGGIRHDWGAWCNVRGAGLGPRPVAAPKPGIDAYVWIKPPGESDGVSDPGAPRFDAHCMSQDSVPGAPQAGQWFDAYFVELATNATPAL